MTDRRVLADLRGDDNGEDAQVEEAECCEMRPRSGPRYAAETAAEIAAEAMADLLRSRACVELCVREGKRRVDDFERVQVVHHAVREHLGARAGVIAEVTRRGQTTAVAPGRSARVWGPQRPDRRGRAGAASRDTACARPANQNDATASSVAVWARAIHPAHNSGRASS